MKRKSFNSLVRRLRQQQKNSTVLVAIDGPGGAGKSSFADGLRESDPTIQIVQMDDFYRPSAERTRSRSEVGSEFDWRRLRRQVLEPLRRDRPARYQRYDWPSDRLAEWHSINAGGIVVVEGAYSMRTELADLFDFSIWVESPSDVRLARGLARDGEAMRERWTSEWMPEEDRYATLQDPAERADLVVDGTVPYRADGAPSFVALRERWSDRAAAGE